MAALRFVHIAGKKLKKNLNTSTVFRELSLLPVFRGDRSCSDEYVTLFSVHPGARYFTKGIKTVFCRSL